MERLIADANTWAKENGKAADLSIDSFSDVVTAIDYIQQKQNIAGTTAREAGSTIAGSFQMTRAAWDNLVTGFADPEANIAELTQNVIESAGIAAQNVLPAIMQALDGIGQAFTEILPTIVAKIPEAISQVGMPMLNAGMGLVMNLIAGLTQSGPQIIEAAMGVVGNLLLGIAQQLPSLLTAGINMIASLLEGFASGEEDLADKIAEIVKTLVKGLIDAAPEIGAAMLRLLRAAADAFGKINWLSLGLKLMRGVSNGIRSIGPSIVSFVKGVVSSVVAALGFSGAAAKASAAFESIKAAISDKIEAAKQKVSSVIDTIKGFFPFSIGKIFSFTLPSISIGSQSKSVGGKSVTGPTFNVGWRHFAKAANTPYEFTKPTIFDVAGDNGGSEILYGKSNLMRDMKEAVKGNGNPININLNYDASNDATDMLHDLVRGVTRYRMAGVI